MRQPHCRDDATLPNPPTCHLFGREQGDPDAAFALSKLVKVRPGNCLDTAFCLRFHCPFFFFCKTVPFCCECPLPCFGKDGSFPGGPPRAAFLRCFHCLSCLGQRLSAALPLPFVSKIAPFCCASTAFRVYDSAFLLCFHCLSCLRQRLSAALPLPFVSKTAPFCCASTAFRV